MCVHTTGQQCGYMSVCVCGVCVYTMCGVRCVQWRVCEWIWRCVCKGMCVSLGVYECTCVKVKVAQSCPTL